jgi:hypothetical protein
MALSIAALAISAGRAHDAKSQHGGRTAEAGEQHVELVTKADVVDVFLMDHNNKNVSSAGYKGLAILVIDGKSQRIVLAPAGESRLTGKAAGNIQGTPQGVVQITPPNGKTVQARFN